TTPNIRGAIFCDPSILRCFCVGAASASRLTKCISKHRSVTSELARILGVIGNSAICRSCL
ncbi:unnamed protein product, partial [Rotaria sp. Silwood2]